MSKIKPKEESQTAHFTEPLTELYRSADRNELGFTAALTPLDGAASSLDIQHELLR